jgi:hypothetical protein
MAGVDLSSTTDRALGARPTFSTVEAAHTRYRTPRGIEAASHPLYRRCPRPRGTGRPSSTGPWRSPRLCRRRRDREGPARPVQCRAKHPVICWMAATLDRTALLPGPLFDSVAEPHARAASILVDELDAGFFQNSFDVRERFWVARVPSDFEVGDRIAMQAGRLGEVSYRPIQGGASHSHLCACHSHLIVPLSHVATAHAYHEGVKLSCLRR